MHVGEIIDSIEDVSKMFISKLFYVQMKTGIKNRVVVIGDARHARSPVSGMGTSLAIEDAFVLADELRNNQSVCLMLKEYEKRRKWRVRYILRLIDFVEKYVMSKSRFDSKVRDLIFVCIPNWLLVFLLNQVFKHEA